MFGVEDWCLCFRFFSVNVGVIYGGKFSNFCFDWVKVVMMMKFLNFIDGNKFFIVFKINKIFSEKNLDVKK